MVNMHKLVELESCFRVSISMTAAFVPYLVKSFLVDPPDKVYPGLACFSAQHARQLKEVRSIRGEVPPESLVGHR